MGEEEKGRRKKDKKREKKKLTERSSTFSLNFSAIRPSVFGGARDQVLPRSKSFKLRPKTRSFDKLQEVGVYFLLGLFLV